LHRGWALVLENDATLPPKFRMPYRPRRRPPNSCLPSTKDPAIGEEDNAQFGNRVLPRLSCRLPVEQSRGFDTHPSPTARYAGQPRRALPPQDNFRYQRLGPLPISAPPASLEWAGHAFLPPMQT